MPIFLSPITKAQMLNLFLPLHLLPSFFQNNKSHLLALWQRDGFILKIFIKCYLLMDNSLQLY